jgi:hypothetical protein
VWRKADGVLFEGRSGFRLTHMNIPIKSDWIILPLVLPLFLKSERA